MTNGHSEEYFKDYRDFWWNHDFLELMASRLHLGDCTTLLDVGCGQCHWSRLLVAFMKKPSEVHAVDSDPKWAAGGAELTRFFETQCATIQFKHGDAQALPYDDSSFDVVTCQTTLIHLRNPKAAISEMHRVAKPGGLVLCVEPNNVAGSLVKSNLTEEDSIEAIIKDVKYALAIERGKKLLGEGDNSYGDLLPGAFADVGLDDIRVYLSDKATPMYRPYKAPEQQAMLRTIQDWETSNSGPHDWAEQARYLNALGQESDGLCEEMQKRSQVEMIRYFDAVKTGCYFTAGGTLMYLVSGRKVEPDSARRQLFGRVVETIHHD